MTKSTVEKRPIQKTEQTAENEIIYERTQDIIRKPPKEIVQHVLSNDELIEYMYQHIRFEIPFDSDPLYDRRQIYTHVTAHIEYGLYENIEASAAFSFRLQTENEIENIKDKNTQYMHNLGRSMSTGHNMSIQAVRKEVYDDEQNEILEMNAQNTKRSQEAHDKMTENILNIHNMDMSQEAPMMPVYTPIIDEHHGVMFVNSSKHINETCFYHVLYDSKDQMEILAHDVTDTETFAYRNKITTNNTPMVEVVFFDTDKAIKVLFDRDMYAQIEYNEGGNLKAMYKNELEIPAFIDNGASVNVLPKAFYDEHKILHALPKVSANMQQIMTGNGAIPAYFWIDMPLEIQGVHLQLRCIVCNSTAEHGLLISRMSLDQMQVIQLYDKRQILIKINAIPLVLMEGVMINFNQNITVMAKLLVTDPALKCKPIQGEAVSWITTNRDGFPFVPVVSEYISNKTSIGFRNNSFTTQSLRKGQIIGYLDLRSKDGSLTRMQWLIPMNHNMHDYILYGHTFASALEKQALAQEDAEKQLNNQFKVRGVPIKVSKTTIIGDDPYPWLDKDDPRRNLTDRQILEDKIKLQDSILTPQEKTKFIDLLKTKRDTFSLRDEIGTCPYFEVWLQLRDEMPFFVQPYPIREEQKHIVQ